MAGPVRALLFVGAAARLSLLLEMHTRIAPNAPKLVADLKNKVANVAGLNSTDVAVEMLPDNFFFPCPAVLNGADSPYHKSEATAVAAARQLHGHGHEHGHDHWHDHGHDHHHHHDHDHDHDHVHFVDGPQGRMEMIGMHSIEMSPFSMMLESHFGGDDDDDNDDDDDDDDDDEPVPEHGDRAATCAECLAAGKDYCIADNRCTKRATRTCAGPEDHVTGSPEFARTSPGHSMKCPKPDADRERGFLARGGPLAHHGRRGFPVLLEVRGKTSHE